VLSYDIFDDNWKKYIILHFALLLRHKCAYLRSSYVIINREFNNNELIVHILFIDG